MLIYGQTFILAQMSKMSVSIVCKSDCVGTCMLLGLILYTIINNVYVTFLFFFPPNISPVVLDQPGYLQSIFVRFDSPGAIAYRQLVHNVRLGGYV